MAMTELDMVMNAASDLYSSLQQEGRPYSAGVVDALMTLAGLDQGKEAESRVQGIAAKPRRGRKPSAAPADAATAPPAPAELAEVVEPQPAAMAPPPPPPPASAPAAAVVAHYSPATQPVPVAG